MPQDTRFDSLRAQLMLCGPRAHVGRIEVRVEPKWWSLGRDFVAVAEVMIDGAVAGHARVGRFASAERARRVSRNRLLQAGFRFGPPQERPLAYEGGGTIGGAARREVSGGVVGVPGVPLRVRSLVDFREAFDPAGDNPEFQRKLDELEQSAPPPAGRDLDVNERMGSIERAMVDSNPEWADRPDVIARILARTMDREFERLQIDASAALADPAAAEHPDPEPKAPEIFSGPDDPSPGDSPPPSPSLRDDPAAGSPPLDGSGVLVFRRLPGGSTDRVSIESWMLVNGWAPVEGVPPDEGEWFGGSTAAGDGGPGAGDAPSGADERSAPKNPGRASREGERWPADPERCSHRNLRSFPPDDVARCEDCGTWIR